MLDLLRRGNEILEMMQVTGEEGITLENFVTYQKSLFVDMVYLQQDAFDEADASVPLERQKQIFDLVYDMATRDYRFDDKNTVREFFTRLTGLCKNLNYSRADSPQYADYFKQIDEFVESVTAKPYAPRADEAAGILRRCFKSLVNRPASKRFFPAYDLLQGVDGLQRLFLGETYVRLEF
jgi:C-terminal domain of V and A type ATP synthase